MNSRITRGAIAVSAAAVLVVPATAAMAKPNHDKPAKAKDSVSVSKLSILHAKKDRDVTTKDAVLKAQVKVKDHSKKFAPDTVTLKVVQKDETSEMVQAFPVDAKLVGKSKVASNWRAKITIPAGTAAGKYCIRLVKVDMSSTDEVPPTVVRAKGLQGRDCVTVINSAASDA
jgi:hypothetical protein